jgi:hypothetical protein
MARFANRIHTVPATECIGARQRKVSLETSPYRNRFDFEIGD